MARRWSVLVVVALVAAACSSSAPPAGSPAASPAPATQAPATEATEPEPTQAASEAPAPESAQPEPSEAAGPDRYEPGTTVIVSKEDVDLVEITVSDVSEAEAYEGEVVDDEPATPGNVFIQAYVDYVAIADDTAYNSLDWTLLVDGVKASSFTFLLNGPEPTLGSGTLASGDRAGGWLVYEVPPTGEVVLQYGDIIVFQDGPVFEVILR